MLNLSVALIIISIVFWDTLYILILRKGLKEKTYGMPIFAFCMNIFFEYVFITPISAISNLAVAPFVVEFLLDFGNLYLIIRFGPKEFRNFTVGTFYAMIFVFFIIISAVAIYIAPLSPHWALYMGTFGTLAMSILFLNMFFKRKDGRGQSLAIGILKFVGNAAAGLGVIAYSPIYLTPVVVFYAVTITPLDLAYVVLVFNKLRSKNRPKYLTLV